MESFTCGCCGKAFWAGEAKSPFPVEFVWLLAACDAISGSELGQ
jgi:hypothetical protein